MASTCTQTWVITGGTQITVREMCYLAINMEHYWGTEIHCGECHLLAT